MDRQVLSNIALLAGILLIVAGIVGALLAGFDPLYGIPGFSGVAVGGLLVWWGRKHSDGAESSQITSGRAVQKPDNASTKVDRSKLNRKI